VLPLGDSRMPDQTRTINLNRKELCGGIRTKARDS
jgi:hypothetical protein